VRNLRIDSRPTEIRTMWFFRRLERLHLAVCQLVEYFVSSLECPPSESFAGLL
jgi:hypothetical protein